MKPLSAPDSTFAHLEAAREWRLTPDEWRARPVHVRAEMLAHIWIKDTREAYSAQGRLYDPEEQKKRTEGRNNTGGMAVLKQFRQSMRPPPGWKPKKEGS